MQYSHAKGYLSFGVVRLETGGHDWIGGEERESWTPAMTGTAVAPWPGEHGLAGVHEKGPMGHGYQRERYGVKEVEVSLPRVFLSVGKALR